MNLQETLLSALATYGAIAIFVTILMASIGVPFPVSFLLIVAGSFVEAGDLQFWPVVIAGITGAIIGDHAGYSIGWFGGRKIASAISRRFKAEGLLEKAEATSRRWGGVSVFFSRWLITAIGPYINLTSGITRYALPRFSIWVVLGEVLWVILYVYIGRLFSDRVAEISDLLGDFTYVLLGLVALIILGYQLVKTLRKPKAA
jgi:membrane protein DedA with SNARE-associated domain